MLRRPGRAAALPRRPLDLARADRVALEGPVQRVRLPGARVVRLPGVLAAERERVDAHLVRELVDGLLERERALDVPRRAERRERTSVRDHAIRLRAQVLEVIKRVRRSGRVRDPFRLTDVRPRVMLDRGDASVAATELQGLIRRRAVAGSEVLLAAREHAAD